MKTSVKKLISMAICLTIILSLLPSCLVYAEENVLSVSQALTATDGTLAKVEGLYVGISKEGSKSADNPAKEMLIKDLSSDAIIAVRDVPYGTWPDYGYEKGDKIEFTATVKDDASTNNPGKKYLVFSADNGEIENTIISRGNEVTYNLNDVVTLSTWAEMKNFFKSSTIKPYTYVKFTESSYFQYYDTTQTYRIHKNDSAGSLAAIKPDTAHAISLKNDVHSANLGSDWTKLFFESYNPPAKWPGLSIDKEFYALYVGGDSIHFEMVILDASWVVNEPTDEPTVEPEEPAEPDEPTDEPYVAEFDNYDIVNEIALAYQRQNLAGQSFYDMNNGRRNMYSSPEDSTSQRTVYLDCSSFVNSIYSEAFGVNILPYKISETNASTKYYDEYTRTYNGVNVDVVGHWETPDYPTDEDKQEVIDWIKSNLQVGDILNYRHGKTSGTSGHVYMYMGDEKFIHRPGAGSYNVVSSNPALSYDVERNDPIEIFNYSRIFNKSTNSRYIFRSTESDSIWSFSLLRPLARNLTPTEETISRMQTPGLDAEKVSSVFENNAVAVGDIITYTITLENTSSNYYKDIVVSDVIPANTEFVSASNNVVVKGNKLSWQGDIKGKEKVVVSYDVRVTGNTKSKLIISNSAYVNKVKLGNIMHTISAFDNDALNALSDKANEYAGVAKSGSALDIIRDLYNDVYGYNVLDGYSVADILDSLLDSENYVCKTDSPLYEMLVPNLYGGLNLKEGYRNYVNHNDRTRLVSKQELAIGDIIIADWKKGNIVFMYMGDSKLLAVEDGKCTALTIGDNIFENPDNILISLLAYDRFVILRPSMTEDAKNVALPEYFDVSKHSDTNIVYLEGKLDNTSDKNYVTLIVNNSDGEVAYVGQYKADNVGKYSAKFNLAPGNYTYSVKSGSSDVTENVTLVEVSAPTFTAEISLKNNKAVNAIADITNKYSKGESFKMIIAFYAENNELIGCKISDRISVSFDETTSSKEFSADEIPEEAVKIKAFAWKNTSTLTPVAKEVEIEL